MSTTTMLSSFAISELIAARFSHDLAGPIGAINNGVEFLKEEEFQMTEQAIQLVEVSAKEAVARLQFYRITYGVPQQVGEANLAHLKERTEQFFGYSKITLDWPEQHTTASPISISNRMGRLLLNIILTASHTLIRGGTISVRLQRLPNGKRITVASTGDQIRLEKETKDLLTGKTIDADIDKSNVQLFLTQISAKEIGAKISVNHTNRQAQFIIDYVKNA